MILLHAAARGRTSGTGRRSERASPPAARLGRRRTLAGVPGATRRAKGQRSLEGHATLFVPRRCASMYIRMRACAREQLDVRVRARNERRASLPCGR